MSDTAFTDILEKVSAYAGTALTIPLPNGGHKSGVRPEYV